VPRDREGQFHTQVFERYSRDAPQVAQGLTEMFVVDGSGPSAGAISRLNQKLEPIGNLRQYSTGIIAQLISNIGVNYQTLPALSLKRERHLFHDVV